MLKEKKLGLAGGILWGVSLFIITLISVYTGYAADALDLMTGLYPGYEVTIWGSFIGLFWGFVDAFIGLYLLAWLYNKLDV